jgi:hypothetical protein
VCLQVGNSANWAAGVSYIRLSFTPETDQYSRFYVPNCTNRKPEMRAASSPRPLVA